jgi:hypothetical protein
MALDKGAILCYYNSLRCSRALVILPTNQRTDYWYWPPGRYWFFCILEECKAQLARVTRPVSIALESHWRDKWKP